jgi:tetratricopeptide (TPR) repeat protein
LEADRLYDKTIAFREKAPGTDHTKLAVALENRAIVLSRLGIYEEAEVLYRRALDTFERSFGPDSPRLVPGLQHYAILLRKTKRKKKAKQLERRAAMIKAADQEQRELSLRVDVNSLRLMK